MNTQTLESMPQNATLAISTPADIDLVELVKVCAKRKSKDGQSFTGKKGKASLFSAVCSMYRSERGLPKLNEDGSPARLADSVVQDIEKAIETFWARMAASLVSYGEVVSYHKDVSAVKLNDKGEAIPYLTATMKAKRQCADISEWHRTANLLLAKAQKRMDYMLDNAGDYSRDEFDEQRIKISALEKAALVKEMPKVS